jgi:hypothetical protein
MITLDGLSQITVTMLIVLITYMKGLKMTPKLSIPSSKLLLGIVKTLSFI